MTKILIEIEVEVTGEYMPGEPGVHTYPNGDPGYPPTPPSFDIHEVKLNGTNISHLLSIDDLMSIEDQMLDT
jgi:hypothetical protein